MKKKYFEFIEALYERRQAEAGDERVTKKSLREEYLPPELSIIPLSSEQELTEAVAKFGILTRIKVELLSVNAEADNNPFFRIMRGMKDAVGADKATFVEHQKNGLNADAIVDQLGQVAAGGNARVVLSGTTPNQERLDVTNEEIRLRVPLANVPPEKGEKAKVLLETFNELIEDETIIIDRTDPDQARAVRDKFRQ